jgi:biopolymer transport protein ExbD
VEVTRPRRRNPHAHFVSVPGYRARLSRARRDWRRAVPVLALTAFLDVLLVTNAFALAVAQPPSGCLCLTPDIDTPSAVEVTDLIDAPMITIEANGLAAVDGQAVDIHHLAADVADPLPELSALLRTRRDLVKTLEPGREPPRSIVLNVDRETPAYLVKRVISAAARAGYDDLSFMVMRRFESP